MASSAGQFNYYDSRYRCCCNSMHITKGTKVLSIVICVLSILAVISGIIQKVWYSAAVSAILVIFAALMFYGVMKERKIFLMPYIIYQSIICLFDVIMIVLSIVALASENSFMYRYYHDLAADSNGYVKSSNVVRTIIVWVIIISVIQLALAFWFLYIAYTCYKFFSLKDCCGGHSGGQQVGYSAQQVGYSVQQTTYGGGQGYPAQQVIYTGQPTTTYITTTSTAVPRYG